VEDELGRLLSGHATGREAALLDRRGRHDRAHRIGTALQRPASGAAHRTGVVVDHCRRTAAVVAAREQQRADRRRYRRRIEKRHTTKIQFREPFHQATKIDVRTKGEKCAVYGVTSNIVGVFESLVAVHSAHMYVFAERATSAR
jgi:hypothetical protein